MNAHPAEGKPSGGPLESAPAAAAPTPSPYPPTEHSELRARVRISMPGLTAARADQLLQILTAIGDAVTEQQLFEALVDEVARALGASTAGLWILDETGVRAELVRGVGYPEESRERIASFSLPTAIRLPIIDALQGDTPIFIGSLDELFARYPLTRPYATSGRSYRMACLPLVAQRRNLGALALTGDVLQPDEHEEKDCGRSVLVRGVGPTSRAGDRQARSMPSTLRYCYSTIAVSCASAAGGDSPPVFARKRKGTAVGPERDRTAHRPGRGCVQ